MKVHGTERRAKNCTYIHSTCAWSEEYTMLKRSSEETKRQDPIGFLSDLRLRRSLVA